MLNTTPETTNRAPVRATPDPRRATRPHRSQPRWHGLALLALLTPFALLLPACEVDVPDFPRGDLGTVVLALDDTHVGWERPNCALCHTTAHGGTFEVGECSVCHGANGAPQLRSAHPGWESGTCDGCHSDVEKHPAGLVPMECGGCHGDNGGGLGPVPSPAVPTLDSSHFGWRNADCAECHSAAGTHGGAYTIPGCGGCHGSNGGPLRPENHWLTDCNDCHADGPEPWNGCSHEGYALQAARACILCHR